MALIKLLLRVGVSSGVRPCACCAVTAAATNGSRAAASTSSTSPATSTAAASASAAATPTATAAALLGGCDDVVEAHFHLTGHVNLGINRQKKNSESWIVEQDARTFLLCR